MNQYHYFIPPDHPCSKVVAHFTPGGTLVLDQDDDSVVMTAGQREQLATLLASQAAVAS